MTEENLMLLMPFIRRIEEEPSRSVKEHLLSILVRDQLGAWIVKMAYDPFITYGLTPDPLWLHLSASEERRRSFTREGIEPVLMRLSVRELTGNEAKEELYKLFGLIDADAREILFRILLKDLKCGIGPTTIQKVAPGLVPVFAVMRAHIYAEAKVKKWPVKGEYKLDGQRNTFLCRDGMGAFFTRSGQRVPSLDFLVSPVMKVARAARQTALSSILNDKQGQLSFMLDGEAMMGLFEETGALRRKDANAVGAELHLYDMMPYADFDAVGSVGAPLKSRRPNLDEFVSLSRLVLTGDELPILQKVPQFYLNSDEEVHAFFEKARAKTLASYLARGDKARELELLKTTIDRATGRPKVLEGIVVKDENGLYDKKKSYGWMKMKPEETEDLRIIGAYPGDRMTKYENCLGGLVVKRDGVHVRVGGGFSDLERIELWNLFQKDLDRSTGVLWRKEKDAFVCVDEDYIHSPKYIVDRLIEVEFHEVTPDGSLRHPRFIRFRDDKDGEVEDKAA